MRRQPIGLPVQIRNGEPFAHRLKNLFLFLRPFLQALDSVSLVACSWVESKLMQLFACELITLAAMLRAALLATVFHRAPRPPKRLLYRQAAGAFHNLAPLALAAQ